MPRLFCVVAQPSGTRLRVRTSRAARQASTACSRRSVPLSRAPRVRKYTAEVVLRHGPVERNALAGVNLKGGAVGLHGLFQALGVALARAQGREVRCRGCSASWPSRAERARG